MVETWAGGFRAQIARTFTFRRRRHRRVLERCGQSDITKTLLHVRAPRWSKAYRRRSVLGMGVFIGRDKIFNRATGEVSMAR